MNVFEHIVNKSKDFITLIDSGYTYILANDTYCEVMGKPREAIVGRTVSEVWGEERFRSTIKAYLDRCLAGEEVNVIDSFKFGPFQKYMHVTYYPYRDNGSGPHALVFSHDITRIGEIESKLTNYKYRDPVTGLFNRRSLGIILEKEIEKARSSRADKLRAVLCVGLQNLDAVQQIYGYELSDLLLENTGLRIRSVLKPSDYVARFDGHEMAAILTDIQDKDGLANLASGVFSQVSIPYRYRDVSIAISCAIGISVYPDDGNDAETIMRSAQMAMAEARKRNEPYHIFNPELHSAARRRLILQRELYDAFVKKQFALHYQPIVDSKGCILGAEALLRWYHPQRGILLPESFLPLAISSGLIRTIGHLVLFTACEQVRRWTQAHEVFVSINLSASEFCSEDLILSVSRALKRAGNLDPRRIRLEVTETECMGCPEASIKRMEALKNMGVDIFLDDFGTGQSSLSYLKNLPATVLKIDKSFIADAELQEERQFLRYLINIIKSRNKLSLMEGVSTPGQAWVSNTLSCDMMQGVLFSPPVPAASFEKLLECGEPLPLSSPETRS